MKHVLLQFLLVMMVVWFISARRVTEQHRQEPALAITTGSPLRVSEQAHRDALRAASEARHQARQAMAEAQHEIQRALHQARHDVHEALGEARQEVHEALGEVDQKPLAEAPVPAPPRPPAPSASPIPGLPGLVPHPGSPERPSPPVAVIPAQPGERSTTSVKPENTRTIVGLVSATEERARNEARKNLDEEVALWLEPHGVPRSWRPSPKLIDDMILASSVKPIVKDYGTVYEADLKVDVSPERRSLFYQSYQRQLVHGRLVVLGGSLAFVLICLGAVSGYIRADEATKGYYTNRLRLLAAAGVGAAGMAIYHALA